MQDEPFGLTAEQRWSYDEAGRVSSIGEPGFTESPVLLGAKYQYDWLDRPVSKQTPLGETRACYYGDSVLLSSESGQLTRLLRDPTGRILSVTNLTSANVQPECATDGAPLSTINLGYDSLDNLTTFDDGMALHGNLQRSTTGSVLSSTIRSGQARQCSSPAHVRRIVGEGGA
jgi:hypothetical protein